MVEALHHDRIDYTHSNTAFSVVGYFDFSWWVGIHFEAISISQRASGSGVASFSFRPKRSFHSTGGVSHFLLLVVTTQGASPSFKVTSGKSFGEHPTM